MGGVMVTGGRPRRKLGKKKDTKYHSGDNLRKPMWYAGGTEYKRDGFFF